MCSPQKAFAYCSNSAITARKTSHGTARRRCQVPRGDAGSLFGLLMWRLAGKVRLSVEEVNTLFQRLAIPAVKTALR
jgi:hypothetical protein